MASILTTTSRSRVVAGCAGLAFAWLVLGWATLSVAQSELPSRIPKRLPSRLPDALPDTYTPARNGSTSSYAPYTGSVRAVRRPDPADAVGMGTLPKPLRTESRASYGASVTFQDFLGGWGVSNDDEMDLEQMGRASGRGRLGSGLRGDPVDWRRPLRRSDLFVESPLDRADDGFNLMRRRAAGTESPADRTARLERYVKYLRERDPAKRAQLYRDYQQTVTTPVRSARGLSGSASSTTTSASRTGARGSELRRSGSMLDRSPSSSMSRSPVPDSTRALLFPSSTSRSSERDSTRALLFSSSPARTRSTDPSAPPTGTGSSRVDRGTNRTGARALPGDSASESSTPEP